MSENIRYGIFGDSECRKIFGDSECRKNYKNSFPCVNNADPKPDPDLRKLRLAIDKPCPRRKNRAENAESNYQNRFWEQRNLNRLWENF